MKVISNKIHRHTILKIFLCIAIIGFIILVLVYSISNYHNTNKNTQYKANSSQGAAGTTTYSQSSKTNDDTYTVPETSSDIPLTIVDASQYNGQFEVRAYANIDENGTCTFTFTKGTKSLKKESIATGGPITSSCQTIDVPTSDLGDVGDWQLNISYISNSRKYSGSTVKTITIK